MKMTSAAAIAFLASASAVAQDSNVVGKYTGSLNTMNDGGGAVQLVLKIEDVTDGKVSGVLQRFSSRGRNPCNGEYPIEGTLKGNALMVRASEKGGRAGDCPFRITAG